MSYIFPNSADDIYPLNRDVAFNLCKLKFAKDLTFESDTSLLAQGDSLELIKQIPSSAIDLILTDPPYHTTKKANIYGDANFDDDNHYLNWMNDYFKEFHRVLRPNGSLYLFCSSEMAPFLYVNASKTMNMHNIITWTKPNEPGYDGWKQKMKKTSLRKWYPHSEKIVVCSPASDGNLKRSAFGMFLKDCRNVCNLTSHVLTEKVGAFGKVNNGGAVSNWETGRNIPSRSQYSKICDAFTETGKIKLMPAYEDVIRAFQINPDVPYTDVWEHMNVRQYKGKHPAEKPLDLIELIISTSSYKNDVVLDCFSGSGSTLVVAQKMGRKSIGIEIEEKWVNYASATLSATLAAAPNIKTKVKTFKVKQQEDELPLFSN